MGWGAGDDISRKQADLLVSQIQGQMYMLEKTLAQISHQEKREVLLHSLQLAQDQLEHIQFQLGR